MPDRNSIPHRHRCPSQPTRRGATVLEVMFAIFVVIVGLMGIASIIPLAARNAEDSNAYNQALAQGRIWLNDFLARGLNDPDRFSTRGIGFNWLYRGPNGGLQPFFKPAVGLQSVCIDPMFMTDPEVVQLFNSGSLGAGSYSADVFPYFTATHNPIDDPFGSPANALTAQPRMIRATLGGTAGQIPGKLAKEIFASKDDVATFINDDDKTIPASRIFSGGGVKAQTTGDYSWLATLSPEPVENPVAGMITYDYVLSLVILQRRDRQFIAPGTTPVPGSAENKPQGERLVAVQPLSGNFVNGNGGRVRLTSNRFVEDRLHVGDWIMLGKYYAANQTGQFGYFRWYRIIAIDADPLIDTTTWTRDVVLEGPDWDFTPQIGSVQTPTTGTLMSDVVTVIERFVTVE